MSHEPDSADESGPGRLDAARLDSRSRLNSTSRNDEVPVFQPGSDAECDRTYCTPECSR